jgi:hypothetical protein
MSNYPRMPFISIENSDACIEPHGDSDTLLEPHTLEGASQFMEIWDAWLVNIDDNNAFETHELMNSHKLFIHPHDEYDYLEME